MGGKDDAMAIVRDDVVYRFPEGSLA